MLIRSTHWMPLQGSKTRLEVKKKKKKALRPASFKLFLICGYIKGTAVNIISSVVPNTRFLFHVKELEQIELQSDEVEQQGRCIVVKGKRKKLAYESNKGRNMLAQSPKTCCKLRIFGVYFLELFLISWSIIKKNTLFKGPPCRVWRASVSRNWAEWNNDIIP